MTPAQRGFDDHFGRELLKSERRRILALITAYVIILGFTALRQTLEGWTLEMGLMLIGILVLGTGQEILVLRRVQRAINNDSGIASWVWTLNVIAECLVPTIVLTALPGARGIPAIDALNYPVSHAYYIFIALSTLHLSPRLCMLAGIVSAAGYGIVASWHLSGGGDAPARFPVGNYVTFGVFMIVVALAAAAVAREIRRYMERALSEAEARGKIERDLDIARSIQAGLLPREALTLPGFTVAGRSEPADQTGGDYFDWQVLGDGNVAVSLADVTGHGVGPALIAAVCRAYARATALMQPKPDDLAKALNDLLEEDLPDDRFVTFVTAVLTTETATVDLLAAGHGPVMHVRSAEKVVEHFDAHSVPLGIMPGLSHALPAHITLAHGDILALITDGLFEQRNNEGEAYGLDRLQASLLTHAGKPAETLVAGLFEDLDRFAGNAARKDDVTAVIIQRAAA